jgi:hypothetical protein
MPIVATVKLDLLNGGAPFLLAPSKHHSLEGREHGRTIPLAEVGRGGSNSLVSCGEVTPDQRSRPVGSSANQPPRTSTGVP